MLLWLTCSYSIGSSIVMMCFDSRRLMSSTSAASVVVSERGDYPVFTHLASGLVTAGVPTIFSAARGGGGQRPEWLETEARLSFLIGLSVARGAARPRWNADSPLRPAAD